MHTHTHTMLYKRREEKRKKARDIKWRQREWKEAKKRQNIDSNCVQMMYFAVQHAN